MLLNLLLTTFDTPRTELSADEIFELIKRIANEDTQALHILYDAIRKPVYAFAYSIMQNKDDADDVTQDTFVKIYSSAASYQNMGKPMAWILTIVKNLARMKLRELKRTGQMDFSENENLLAPTEFASNSEAKLTLLKALNILNEESRQIVVLHAAIGMKHREIAEMMGLGLSTVLSKYKRAIEKLKKEIGKEDGFDA